jgi:hypothetical protein
MPLPQKEREIAVVAENLSQAFPQEHSNGVVLGTHALSRRESLCHSIKQPNYIFSWDHYTEVMFA